MGFISCAKCGEKYWAPNGTTKYCTMCRNKWERRAKKPKPKPGSRRAAITADANEIVQAWKEKHGE